MKMFLFAILIALPCHASEWFDTTPKSSWQTGPLQTLRNPALGSMQKWEHKNSLLDVKFETAFATSAGMSGRSHGKLLDFMDRAERTIDIHLNHTSIPSSAIDISKTYAPVIMLMNDFYNLDEVPRGDGYHLDMSSSVGFSLQNVFMKRDAISFAFTKTTSYGWSFKLDKYLNEYLRMLNVSSYQWTSGIATAKSHWPQGYNTMPVTPAGFRYAQELIAVGYTLDEAMFLAFLLESAGLDFSNESAKTVLSWLRNSLWGTGDSVIDGDILEGNKSGVRSRLITIAEYGLTYSFPIEMFTFGITAKYMLATKFDKFARRSEKPGFEHFDNMRDAKKAFGIDVGIIFTPIETHRVSISLSAKNVNAPTFLWKNDVVKLTPQFRLGSSVAPFGGEIPLAIGFDIDLNRAESYVLPGYHTQNFKFQIEIDPKLDPVSFNLCFGFVKNIGENAEPIRIQSGVGLKLWMFNLNIMGDTSLNTIYRGNEIMGFTLPEQFGFSSQIGVNIKW